MANVTAGVGGVAVPPLGVTQGGAGTDHSSQRRSTLASSSSARAHAAAVVLGPTASSHRSKSPLAATLGVALRATGLASLVILTATLVPIPASDGSVWNETKRIIAMLPAWLVNTYSLAMVFYTVTRVVNKVPTDTPPRPRLLPISTVLALSTAALCLLYIYDLVPLLVPSVLCIASLVPVLVYAGLPTVARRSYSALRFAMCTLVSVFGALPFIYSLVYVMWLCGLYTVVAPAHGKVLCHRYVAVFRSLDGQPAMQLLATAILQVFVSAHCCGILPLLRYGNARALHPRLRFFGMFYLYVAVMPRSRLLVSVSHAQRTPGNCC